MKNFVCLTLISFLLLTNLSFAGEKAERPELPDYTEFEKNTAHPKFTLQREEVTLKCEQRSGPGNLVFIIYDKEEKPWLLIHMWVLGVVGEGFPVFESYLYEKGSEKEKDWRFVIEMTDWDEPCLNRFLNEKYSLTYNLEEKGLVSFQ